VALAAAGAVALGCDPRGIVAMSEKRQRGTFESARENAVSATHFLPPKISRIWTIASGGTTSCSKAQVSVSRKGTDEHAKRLDDFDHEAEILKTANEAAGDAGRLATFEVVGTEIHVGCAVREHAIHRGQHGGGHKKHLPTSFCE
jgi:hypothetical protein